MRHRTMKRFSILIVTAFALTACGQAGGTDDAAEAEPSATMPPVVYTVSETDSDNEVVMEATVEISEDGSWESSGTAAAFGELANEQITRIAELAEADDFPEDPDNTMACPTVEPPYWWSLSVGEERVSNGNGGCVSSESAVEIAEIIQEAADVGPTLEENQ